MTTPLYRMFKRVEAPSVRAIVIAFVVVACALTAVGVIRVTRQHEVLRLGYELSREAEHVRVLREARRRLELERGTLTSPDRIRRLATQLGMTSVAPDKIRIVDPTALPFGSAASRSAAAAVVIPLKVAAQP